MHLAIAAGFLPVVLLSPLNKWIPFILMDLHTHGLPAGWFAFDGFSQPVFRTDKLRAICEPPMLVDIEQQ